MLLLEDGRDAIMVPEFDEQGNNVGTQWVPMQYTQLYRSTT
jgi:hypothetical protein